MAVQVEGLLEGRSRRAEAVARFLRHVLAPIPDAAERIADLIESLARDPH
jgi:hypothetical protein